MVGGFPGKDDEIELAAAASISKTMAGVGAAFFIQAEVGVRRPVLVRSPTCAIDFTGDSLALNSAEGLMDGKDREVVEASCWGTHGRTAVATKSR